MKKYLSVFLILILCSVTFVSCSDKDEPKEESTLIKLGDLPATAQQFLNQYFWDKTIYKIDKMVYTDMIIYSVYFEDMQINFNEEGIWQQIYGHTGVAIPVVVLPEPIQVTLKERYNGFGVNQITREGQNFVVVLTNNQGEDGIRLTFNQSGEIISQPLNPV